MKEVLVWVAIFIIAIVVLSGVCAEKDYCQKQAVTHQNAYTGWCKINTGTELNFEEFIALYEMELLPRGEQ